MEYRHNEICVRGHRIVLNMPRLIYMVVVVDTCSEMIPDYVEDCVSSSYPVLSNLSDSLMSHILNILPASTCIILSNDMTPLLMISSKVTNVVLSKIINAVDYHQLHHITMVMIRPKSIAFSSSFPWRALQTHVDEVHLKSSSSNQALYLTASGAFARFQEPLSCAEHEISQCPNDFLPTAPFDLHHQSQIFSHISRNLTSDPNSRETVTDIWLTENRSEEHPAISDMRRRRRFLIHTLSEESQTTLPIVGIVVDEPPVSQYIVRNTSVKSLSIFTASTDASENYTDHQGASSSSGNFRIPPLPMDHEVWLEEEYFQNGTLCVNGSFGHCISLRTLKTNPSTTLETIARDRCIVSSENYDSDELGSIGVIAEPPSHVFTWILIEHLFFTSLFKYLSSSFHFDLFFAFCQNAILLSLETSGFLYLPLVLGELESLQSLLLDASYSHVNDNAMFLKAAFRAEFVITYILQRNEALQFYYHCIQLAKDIGDEIAEARMLIVYGQLLGQSKEHLDEAYRQFRRALVLLEPRGKCKELAWLLTATGWNLFSRGLGICGKQYLFQAIAMFQDLLNYSSNTFRKSSLFSLGYSLLEEEEKCLEQRLAATSSSLGLVLLHLNDPQEALQYLQQSLNLRLGLWEHHPSIGNTYNNISLCHQRLGDKEKALESSRKGLAIKRQYHGNSKELVNSLNNVAINCSLVSGNHTEAIELLEEALILQEQFGLDTSDAATLYTSMSFVYQRMGQLEEALSWYHKAVALRREINGNTHLTTIRLINRLANILIHLRQYAEARDVLEKQLVENKGNTGDDLDKTAKLFTEVNLKTGDQEKSRDIQQSLVSDPVTLVKDMKADDIKDIDLGYLQESKGVRGTMVETVDDVKENVSKSDVQSQSELTDAITVDQGTLKSTLICRESDQGTGGADDDGINSDDDLYGPEDTPVQTSRPHGNISHDEMQTNDEGRKLDRRGSASEMVNDEEEDLYGYNNVDDNNDDYISVCSSSATVCSDKDFATCIEMRSEINPTNQVQQPLAEIKSSTLHQTEPSQRKLHRPRTLHVSPQSAFVPVAVRKITKKPLNNNLPRDAVPNYLTQYHSLSLQPVARPSDNVYDKAFQSFTGSGNIVTKQPPNNGASSLNYRGNQSQAIVHQSHNLRREPRSGTCNSNTYQTSGILNAITKQPNNSVHNLNQQRNPERNHPSSVFLRQSSDPFHSCQIGYHQYRPQPRNVQSLPYIRPTESLEPLRVSNENSKTNQWLEVSNGNQKVTFKDTEDTNLLLSAKQIEGSNNVLRLVLRLDDDDPHDALPYDDNDDGDTYYNEGSEPESHNSL
ncbi:uncharacterized protein [Amphiura filiformis]|uniref:uncharacterized protein n=1 Tax=Amphiura filiformis TaxID=82378 RepID=UPI003B226A91